MIRGSCLCQKVKFEISKIEGSFEYCHCNRCRKISGSRSMPWISVKLEHFHYISGKDAIKTFEAPILRTPPAYRPAFCSHCGSPVPLPFGDNSSIGVPAGLLEDDPQIKPERHIFVEHIPEWDQITDGLPKLTREDVLKHRRLDKT